MKTILLVEDDPGLLRVAQKVLGDAAYVVDSVSDGQQARTKLKAVPYAGIVLDVTVPGSDGYALAEQVGDTNRYTPLVIIGPDEPGARKRAFDAGALAFLPKPFTGEGFRLVIQSVISPAGPRVPAAPRAAPRWSPAGVSPGPSEISPAPSEATWTEGSIAVRFRDGPVHWCTPSPEGGWHCGRCELGVIASGEVGSTCRVCQAEVVPLEEPSRGGLASLILFIVLASLLGWAALTWWP